MALVTPPLFTLNSQYRPNVFVMSMTSTDPLVLAQASIVVDGTGVTSMQKAPAYNIGTTYYFIFDVAKVLQIHMQYFAKLLTDSLQTQETLQSYLQQ